MTQESQYLVDIQFSVIGNDPKIEALPQAFNETNLKCSEVRRVPSIFAKSEGELFMVVVDIGQGIPALNVSDLLHEWLKKHIKSVSGIEFISQSVEIKVDCEFSLPISFNFSTDIMQLLVAARCELCMVIKNGEQFESSEASILPDALMPPRRHWNSVKRLVRSWDYYSPENMTVLLCSAVAKEPNASLKGLSPHAITWMRKYFENFPNRSIQEGNYFEISPRNYALGEKILREYLEIIGTD